MASALSASTPSLFLKKAGDTEQSKTTPKVDYNYKVMCKDCQNPVPNLFEDYASGDVICRDCGSVLLDRVIDMRSEWRTFANEGGNGPGDDPSRVGGPSNPLLADADGDLFLASTAIAVLGAGDNHGGAKDLNRVHARASTKGTLEKNLLKAFRDISAMSERVGLPRIIADRAKAIFKKVEDDKLCRGKTSEGIIAACIYIACRQERVPRTFREISTLTLVPKKDIGRCYKALAPLFIPADLLNSPETSEFGVSLPVGPSTATASASGMAAVSVQDFMARFCSLLNLNMDIQKASVLLSQRVSELTCVAGKSPISVAAAVIYMITQLYPQYKKAHRDISFVAGVSETTIKNTYKEIFPYRYELITPDIAPKSMIDALSN
jgi:transcription initiation factor TFIIB